MRQEINSRIDNLANLIEMDLHSTLKIPGYKIIRVANGWIYENEKGGSTFVPQKV